MFKVILLTWLTAAGAWAQKITVEFDQAADFGKYKTFNIRDGQLNSKNPALNSELGPVHTNRSASTMSAKHRKARNKTSSFSNREKMRRKPLSLRKSRSISLRFL